MLYCTSHTPLVHEVDIKQQPKSCTTNTPSIWSHTPNFRPILSFGDKIDFCDKNYLHIDRQVNNVIPLYKPLVEWRVQINLVVYGKWRMTDRFLVVFNSCFFLSKYLFYSFLHFHCVFLTSNKPTGCRNYKITQFNLTLTDKPIFCNIPLAQCNYLQDNLLNIQDNSEK